MSDDQKKPLGRGPEEPHLSSEQLDAYISIWAKAVDTQMHFNEMSVKARQFGLTFVAAALGLGVALTSREGEPFISVLIFGSSFQLHAIVLLVIASALALYAVKQLDLRVYHKMLRGAVAFGEDFEEHYMKQVFQLNKGMTQAISHFSRYEDAKVVKGTRPYRYSGETVNVAGDKVERFYTLSISTLSILAFLLFLATAHFSYSQQSASEPGRPPVSLSTSP